MINGATLAGQADDRKRRRSSNLSLNEQSLSPSFTDPRPGIAQNMGAGGRRGSKLKRPSMSTDLRLDLHTQGEDAAAEVKPITGCVVHPYSELRFYWDLLILLMMAYTSIILPLQFADLAGDDIAFIGTDQLVNFMFLADLILNFHTGFLDVQNRIIIMDAKLTRVNYLKSWFLPDLLATLPFDIIYFACGTACSADTSMRWTFKWLRALRMCRLLRLTRILSRLQVRSGLRQTTSMAMHFSLAGLFVAHVSACCWYAIGANGGTWIQVEDPQNKWAPPDKYVAAVYWSLTTMSTIGYGDITAGDTYERLFSCVVMVLGTSVYAYGITSVISSMSGVNEQQRRLFAQKDQLNRYLSTMAVPKDLRQKLREYFVHYQNASDAFNEGNVLQMLSPGLRSSLCSIANAPLLRRVSFFQDTDEACINEMAQLLLPNLFVPDEVIIMKGYVGEEMFVIKNGSVQVYLQFGENVQELAVLGAGQFFGEGALLRGKSARRGANVSAITYSLVYSLHVDAMNRMLPRYPKVRAAIMAIAAEREEATATMSVRTFGEEVRSFKTEEELGRLKRISKSFEEAEVAYEAQKSQKSGKAPARSHPSVLARAGESPPPQEVKQLSSKDWLTALGLEKYAADFVKRGYESMLGVDSMVQGDIEVLIKQLGMLQGHAGILRRAYAARQAVLDEPFTA